MKSLSNLYYRNPRLLVLTIALVLVSGLSALAVLPRTEDPEIRGRNALVVTRYPGASAERVEALVSEKLENELREIEEISILESTSSAGVSIVQIELGDAILEADEVWSRVRDRVGDAAQLLPPGVLPPSFEEFEISAYTLITGLVWEADGPVQAALLNRQAEELADVLRALPGTKGVELFGEISEEIRVTVDPHELAALGLTPAALGVELANADAKVAAGLFRSEANDLLIEVAGELDSLERIAAIPIRAGPNDRLLRLGDIATIEKTRRQPQSEFALLGGRTGVAVAVRMESSRRVDQWSERARSAAADFASKLPRGIGFRTLFDQSVYTGERLRSLTGNLALGALLVMVVILFSMGWRSALLVGAALPLSTLMVLQGMRLLGVPLHQMSVTGLIIALGLLIDNAIVMVDEVKHRLADGRSVASAIAAAVQALALPLFGSTLTTVLAFMPLVLMPGPAGEFVGAMSVSVIIALISSFFLSLTVIPALTGLFEGKSARTERAGFLNRGVSSARLTRGYTRAIGFLLAHPLLGMALGVILPIAGFFGATQLEEQFFPAADRDQFQLEFELPRQTSLATVQAQIIEARTALLALPEVAEVHWVAGNSAPKFYYNMIEGARDASYYAQAIVQLHSHEGATNVIRTVQSELDERFPGTQVLARQLEQGPPFDAPVELRLFGPDLDVLRTKGEEARALLAAVPGVIHTRAGLIQGKPKLLFEADPEEVRLAGLTNVELAGRLNSALEGSTGGSLLESTEELPVRVRVADTTRGDLASIDSLELATRGGWTPLASLGSMSLVSEPATIAHRGGSRVNTIQGFIVAGTLPSAALNGFQAALEERGFAMPPGYRVEFGGESAERDDAVANLASSVGVLVILMIATLVLSFQSFRSAAIIGVIAFLSVGLGMLALYAFGHPFGFMAIVGSMGLMGVAINDAIVVLAAIREEPKARAGDRTAVRDVVVRSTRHVVSTTVTTVAGFLPLIVSGSPFWSPLATAIAGGVGGATLLALTFAPAAYVLLGCPRSQRQAADQADALELAAAPV